MLSKKHLLRTILHRSGFWSVSRKDALVFYDFSPCRHMCLLHQISRRNGFVFAAHSFTSPSRKSIVFENARKGIPWHQGEYLIGSRTLTFRLYSHNIEMDSIHAFDQSRSIDPSAIVHSAAEIGEGVVIGPYCTVGPYTKLGNHVHLHSGCHISGNTELGEGCIVLNGAIVGADIPGTTVIGRNNIIGYHAVVGVKCQDLKYKDGDDCFLYVGDNNDIREFVSIHRSSKSSKQTIIGSNNLIMGSCHIAHDCNVGDYNILANGTLLAGHVVVEEYVGIGGGVAVHQFCHIGSFSFVGGGSIVTNDIPRYTMAAGNRAKLRGLNFKGLERHGFSDTEVKGLRRAYQKIFMTRDMTHGGLESRLTELEKNEELMKVAAVHSFIKSIHDSYKEKRRGICNYMPYISN